MASMPISEHAPDPAVPLAPLPLRGLGGRPAERLLCLAFLLSGGAALLLETLWFRQLGLVVGNSVWASAMVLAAFMGGLALGNAVATWWAPRVTRPLRTYALLELGI